MYFICKFKMCISDFFWNAKIKNNSSSLCHQIAKNQMKIARIKSLKSYEIDQIASGRFI